MAVGHISIRAHSRSRGHTAAAALAYRCGAALTCSRTGEVFDYSRRSRRQEIVCSGFAGIGAPKRRSNETVGELAQLYADAIEEAEDRGANSDWHRANACILRDVQIALPYDLNDEQRTTITESFATELSTRYKAVVTWSVHTPDHDGDGRNSHAHIVVPSRNRYGKKIAVLNDRPTGGQEVKALRALWQDFANAALVAAGKEPTVNTGRRPDRNPQPTLGAEVTGQERMHRRKKGLPHKGISVAQMCSDGHSVTDVGRRLGRHVQKVKKLQEQAAELANAAAENAAIPDRILLDAPVAETSPPRTGRVRRPRRPRPPRRTDRTLGADAHEASAATVEKPRSPRRKPRTRRTVRTAPSTVPEERRAASIERPAGLQPQRAPQVRTAPSTIPEEPRATPIERPAGLEPQRAPQVRTAPATVPEESRPASIERPAGLQPQRAPQVRTAPSTIPEEPLAGPIERPAGRPPAIAPAVGRERRELPAAPPAAHVRRPETSVPAQWHPPAWLPNLSIEDVPARASYERPAHRVPERWHPSQWLAGTTLDALPELPEPMRRPPELDLTPLPAPIEISERPDSVAPTPQTTGEREALNQQLKERTAQKHWDQENLARLHRLITHDRAGALAHELLEHYAVGRGRKRPGLRGLDEDANEALLAAIGPEIVDAHHIATRNTPEAFALARDTLERSWSRPGHAERLKRIVDQTFPAYSKQRARARLQAAQKSLATTEGHVPGRDPPHER